MSLRQKTLLIIGLAIISLFLMLILFSQMVLLQSYAQLEQSDAYENTQRVANALRDEMDTMLRQNMDWAQRDASYAFAQGQYTDFPEVNLTDYVFRYNGVNVVLYFDEEQRSVYARAFNLQAQRQVTPPRQIEAYLTADSQLFNMRDGGEFSADGISGIVMLDNTPMLVAATTILPSDLNGEPQGTLIWGRLLNAAFVAQLQEQTRFDLALESYDASNLPADFQTALTSLNHETSITVQALDGQTMAGYVLFHDIFDNPAFVLRVQMPREIYAQGRDSIFYFTLFLVGACALLTVVVLLLLEKAVLSRLARLNASVSRIRHHGDWSGQLVMPGKDEVSGLALSINQMLETLTQSRIQVQKARDNAELRERVMKTLSHDLRAPLSAISLYAEMLQRGMYGDISIKQSEAALSIYSSAKQLIRFVDNLLDEAQLSAGKLSLHDVSFEVAELLKEVETVAQPLAQIKKLTLKFDVAPALPPTLIGDVLRLQQILINLITNSIKYTDEGEITVRLLMPDEQHWTLQVSDTGVGIPAEAMKFIFDAFWQVDDTKTRKAMMGFGLGLSIVKQLAELMHGEIQVVSKPEQGTVFTVTLPLVRVAQLETVAAV